MPCNTEQNAAASERVKKAIADLRILQYLIQSNELDRRLLADFRDAVNRVRNVAWAAQQSLELESQEEDATAFRAVLAGERVRAAHRLCGAIREDLAS